MNFLSSSPQIQRAFEALGITLLHSLWQGFLLMLLLWILLRFIRYKKANLRFILAFGSLMLIMLCFALTFYYEWDNLKPLPSVNQSFSTQAIGQPIALTDLQVTSDTSFWAQIKSETYAIFYQLAENAHLLAIAWLTGSLLFSFRLSLGLWQIHQLKREKQTLPEFWKTKSLEFQQRLGIRQSVEVCINNSLDSPLTLGWLKPMILFPASMLMAMPAEQIESILVHELAHIRRHDYLWNLLQSVAEVILFYHPAYWYIASVLEQEREHACDVITLMFTGRPQVYAQALLQVASLRTTLSTVGLSARGRGKGRSGFAERIRRIVAPQQKKKGVQPLPFLLSFCLIGFLLFAFTLKSPFEDQDTLTTQEISDPLYDSLRAPDYVDYRYRLFDEKSLPEMLDYSSMNDENYIIGKAASEAEPVDVREYFNTSAIFLLDGVIVQDPEQIHISDIRRYEVYHEPLPRALQNLSERPYSSVVRAFSQMPEEIRKSSHIRVGGQVFSSKNDMRIPLADVMVEVQSSGQKTTTNAQGRFSFPSVRKNDTILFHTPSYSKPTQVPVDGREYLGLYAYIPNSSKTAEKLLERLKDRVKPVEIRKSMGLLRESSSPFDSSIYDVMKDIILIDPKTNTAKIKSDVPASQDDPHTYYTIGDPEVLFTLDGIITDPRTVDRTLVENASFETQSVPDGYLMEIKAISKEAAEAVRKEQQKTVIQGTVTDQKTGKPLPGTHIVVEGTTQGTIADLHGRYQIEIPQGSGELLFTYTGYETRTEAVHHRKILDISLISSSQEELEKRPEEIKKQDSSDDESIRIEGRLVNTENGKALVEKVDFFVGKKNVGSIFEYDGSQFDLQVNQNDDTLFYSFNDFKPKTFSLEQGKNLQVDFKKQNTQAHTFADPKGYKKLYIVDQTIKDKKGPVFHLYNTDEAVQKYGRGVSQYNAVVAINPYFQSPTLQPLPKVISGQVTDAATDKPLAGVKIYIKGTTHTLLTDQKGRYRIAVLEEYPVDIVFKLEGYKAMRASTLHPATLAFNNSPLNISLFPEQSKEEVIHTYTDVQDIGDSVLYMINGLGYPSLPKQLKVDNIEEVIVYTKDPPDKYLISGEKAIINYPDNLTRSFGIEEDVANQYKAIVGIKTKYPFNERADNKRNISGQVTDAETGQAVPGVHILLSGTSIGTVTDMNGRYQIRMNENAESLLLSAPGYTHTQILIGDAEILNVKLPSADMKVSKPSADLDSVLVIIDDIPHEGLNRIDDIKLKPEDIEIVEVKKGESAYELMTETQKKRYKRVINIKTRKIPLSNKSFLFEDQLKVFPNPGNENIKVNFTLAEANAVEFELLDKEGTFLTSFEYHFFSAGEQEITIPVSKFPPDTYLLRIKLNGESIMRRVILK
ncbi:carboxypeptidase-like regulatory domain-containing protein [Catalinimonas sp. 4WD22]|uniref:carboxypeptidase-like regulatory domain-containing protein n=1 Tax=Catalinimonas locisalis TaxID=3133978 RepID=UPI0031017D9D